MKRWVALSLIVLASLTSESSASPEMGKRKPTVDALSPEEEFARLLADALKAYSGVNDYTATLTKQERIDGTLRPRERGLFKFRKPLSVYIKWTDGPNAGTRVLYVEGQNDGNLLARKGGLLGIKTFRLDPKGKLAMADNRHPVTEAGIGHMLDLLESNRKRAVTEGRAHVRRLPDQLNLQPPGLRFELQVEADEKAGYYCPRALVTFDPKTRLVVAVQVFGWDKRIVEDYRYLDLRLNVGLTNRDFDPNNPDYGF